MHQQSNANTFYSLRGGEYVAGYAISADNKNPGRSMIINDYGDGMKSEPLMTLDALDNSTDSSLHDDISCNPREVLYIYFVIESSGRVPPVALQVLRDSIEELIPVLKDISESSNVDIRIQTITYNIGVQCLDKEPVPVSEYIPHLIEPFGLNNFGESCVKINSLISLPRFLQFETWPGLQPIVIYLIRSDPTDDFSYGVSKLKQNQFYQRYCQKYVCFAGEEQDRDMYIDSIGNGTKAIRSFSEAEIIRCVHFSDLKEDWFDCAPEFNETRQIWD